MDNNKGTCPACGGTGRMGPYFPGGLSTRCANCSPARPAAPVAGLETVARTNAAQLGFLKDDKWKVVPMAMWAKEYQASTGDDIELVTRSQAEAIIAAERATRHEADLAFQLEYQSHELTKRERDTVQAENAALTARVKEWQEESERKSEDWFDFCKAIGIEIDTHEAVADAINTARSNDGNEFKALETQLAAAREALEWYEEHVSNCRKIGSVGAPSRAKLDRDGGEKARAALEAKP